MTDLGYKFGFERGDVLHEHGVAYGRRDKCNIELILLMEQHKLEICVFTILYYILLYYYEKVNGKYLWIFMLLLTTLLFQEHFCFLFQGSYLSPFSSGKYRCVIM